MKAIDTCGEHRYSPLIPAMRAICQTEPGEEMAIEMDDEQAFCDLKEWLAEQRVGFREIYEGERMTVQFVVPPA